ncbi:DENN-domain-containing protein [Neocallimastix californiae]|uniref:DENN-domain-containing protein n=1 Tax=Neocallimastix californiae TaxID=1754190 RepID=A0A1Y2AA87_9FUNG|nr:DENN-domain-containing protein [Neocallimastix californiae]|eukprot:ORY18915.1 DENN-domain-containing protein [Neocallimastix californiae]
MSSSKDDLKPTLNIANYFFEVGLLDDSLTKQYAKQLNEESANNRRKLKRLLSNANTDILTENKDLLQNFKRSDNFSDISEDANLITVNNENELKFNSFCSFDTCWKNISIKKSLTISNIDTNDLSKELPPLPKSSESRKVSIVSNDEIIRNKRPSLAKSKSISKSSFTSSQHSLNKKISSQSTIDSLNLCINEDDDKKISPETLESNIIAGNNEVKEAELAFNKKFPNYKLKSVSSMPLINSNTLKKSVSKQNIVHEYDDNAPLALLKKSLSKESLNLQKQKSSSSPPTINAIHPIENKYSSNILLRYPEKDCNNVKLADTNFINLFCFPNDISLKYSLKTPYSTYHSFINTNLQGEKSYGVCVIIYEKIRGNVKKSYERLLNKWIKENIDDNEKEYILHIHAELEKQQEELEQTKLKLKEILYKNDFVTKEDLTLHDELSKNMNEIGENIKLYEEILNTLGNKRFISSDNVYQPRCIGVTSSWPWYTILKDWLSLVVRETIGGFGNKICIPLERYIVNILHEIPFPPPGKYEVSISTSEKTLYFSQPPKNEIPIITDFSFYPTFRCLSHNNIIAITEMLLGERKMIFVSSYPALLSNVIETFCSLIYPFEWKYVLIPVLPVKLLQYTHAPGPYIIGVLRDYIDEMKEDLCEEACIIDIDNDIVEYGRAYDEMAGKEIEFPKIPIKEKRKLLTKLNKYAIAGIGEDIIITKNNLGWGKPLGVPKFMMYTYPNGDFISFSRSKVDNDAIYQKIKAQSCNNSTTNSTSSTLNKKIGRMIQNEIEINIVNSNNDVSRYPFDFFSKKRVVSENKNQTITSIPMSGANGNKNNVNNSDSSQLESDDNFAYSNNIKSKKRDSLISKSLSAANLLNSTIPVHNKVYSITTNPMSNSEYLIFQNKLKNDTNTKSNTVPHNIVTTANSISTFSENIGAKKRDGHTFKEFLPDSSNFITIDSPLPQPGCSYNDLTSDQSGARNFVIIPNSNSPTTSKYQDKSFIYKNTCDICEKYLFSSNMKILKCTACSCVIHISCLSKVSNFPCISSFNQPKIRSSFIKIYRNIFKNYRKYIIPHHTNMNDPTTVNNSPQESNNQLEWFNTAGFIKESEKQYQEFLTLFKDTQAFIQFTQDRAEKPATDHSIQYFDELINYKKKKSKLYPKEVPTFFLDKSDAIKKTVEAPKPNQEDLEYDDIMVKSEYFPEVLNEGLLSEPRPCDNLLLPEDIQIMNDDITITSRPDDTINKKKQEYWSWFKIVKDTEIQQEDPFSSFTFNTDEERRALLEKIYKRVAEVIRESTPANKDVLSSFTSERIEKKLDTLYNNVELLKRAADEQLIENNDQKELHINLKSLFELITIYEDHLAKRKQEQDSLIMKTAIDYDSNSSEEEIEIESISPLEKLDNQRVEITTSTGSSKSSVSSPVPATENVKTPSSIFFNPFNLRTQILDQ